MTQDTQIAVRISERLLDVLDDLRRNEKDLPSRAEMIRRLIERGAKHAKKHEAGD
jgi:metal-responsive CopG/Arc/MetJ family transcriptional regulator